MTIVILELPLISSNIDFNSYKPYVNGVAIN